MTKSPSPSKKSKGKSAPDTVSDVVAADTAQTKPPLQRNEEKKTMSEVPSVVQFSEDLASAEAPVPLPPGDYPATIRAAEIKTSQKGNKYCSVQFFIAAESYPADFTEGDPDGMILVYNNVQMEDNQRARYRLRKFIEAIGGKLGASVDVNDWIGLTATVSVQHDTWEGEVRASIGKVVSA